MRGAGQVKRVRRSGSEWRLLLAEFGRSGLEVAAFCRREAISAGSFYRWRKRLDRECGEGRSDAAFVEVGQLNVERPARPRLDLKLDLGDGLILHLVRT